MSYPDEITVNVTQEHIDNGVPRTCSRCPIALAVEELFPDRRVTVTDDIAIARKGAGLWTRYSMPRSAHDFIAKFDTDVLPNASAKPFTFTATRIYPMQDSEA